jgi:RNA polymerase sigma-70 factor (ECF subfamily)
MTKTGTAEADDRRNTFAVNDDQGDDTFERHRHYLTGLAYRMLGSLAEAEDAVQEAWIRRHWTDKSAVASP